MRVEILYFAVLRERVGRDRETLELPDGADVGAARAAIAARHPAVESLLPRLDARTVVTSGYLSGDEPQLGPYARRDRRVREGRAADLLERAG